MLSVETLQITPDLLTLLSEIDEFKGAWRALGSLAPERLSALRRIATIESIGSSNRIEGSKLSDREVERLLANVETKSLATRDEQEDAGYAETMELIFRSWQDIAITENHIRQLHRDLLIHSEKDAWHRGAYKTSSNSIVAFDGLGRQIGVVIGDPCRHIPGDGLAFLVAQQQVVAFLVEGELRVRTRRQLHPGDKIHIAFDLSKCHFFDAASEAAII